MDGLFEFLQRAVRTRSYSDEEGEMAELLVGEMQKLGYEEAYIDSAGNVVGRMGSGSKIIHFDGHMDTVQVCDGESWQEPPFEGRVVDGFLWGRGSVDMKSGLCASIYAVARAKEQGYLEGKSVYVTGSVCEEYCDGVNLRLFYQERGIRPDYCVICEPCDNVITLGHKGKAQIRVRTFGKSAHGSAPEKGRNAVYEMAEIIERVNRLNRRLYQNGEPHGTIVLSDIRCVSASLNAVPSECSIYLDRRLAFGETLDQVRAEMEELIEGKDAKWEVGTLHRTSWKGEELVYEPMHDPWRIEEEHELARALRQAYADVYDREPERFDFWDFGTNAITPVGMGIPTIGFGPGEYKLAHMRDERVELKKVEEACRVYCALIRRL